MSHRGDFSRRLNWSVSQSANHCAYSEGSQTRDRKVASSNLGRGGGRIFSRVSFVCWLLLGVRSTPVLPQWHVEDPGHSAKSAEWQVTPKHAYTVDPTKSEWTDYAAVQAYWGNLWGNELTRNLSGNIRPQSFQLAEPLWTDPSMKSGISVRELISTSKKKEEKKKKKRRPGTFSPNPRQRGKNHHHHHHSYLLTVTVSNSTVVVSHLKHRHPRVS